MVPLRRGRFRRLHAGAEAVRRLPAVQKTPRGASPAGFLFMHESPCRGGFRRGYFFLSLASCSIARLTASIGSSSWEAGASAACGAPFSSPGCGAIFRRILLRGAVVPLLGLELDALQAHRRGLVDPIGDEVRKGDHHGQHDELEGDEDKGALVDLCRRHRRVSACRSPGRCTSVLGATLLR